MNRTEKMIQHAVKAVEFYLLDEKRTVAPEFKGYIASFGAGVIQSGLLPALAFYARKVKTGSGKEDNTPDRPQIIPAMLYIVNKYRPMDERNHLTELLETAKKCASCKPGEETANPMQSLFQHILEKEDMRRLKDEMLDAAVALKLAIRLFQEPDTTPKTE